MTHPPADPPCDCPILHRPECLRRTWEALHKQPADPPTPPASRTPEGLCTACGTEPCAEHAVQPTPESLSAESASVPRYFMGRLIQTNMPDPVAALKSAPILTWISAGDHEAALAEQAATIQRLTQEHSSDIVQLVREVTQERNRAEHAEAEIQALRADRDHWRTEAEHLQFYISEMEGGTK